MTSQSHPHHLGTLVPQTRRTFDVGESKGHRPDGRPLPAITSSVYGPLGTHIRRLPEAFAWQRSDLQECVHQTSTGHRHARAHAGTRRATYEGNAMELVQEFTFSAW